jgi:O-antigen/teichoic acid export membrane protein
MARGTVLAQLAMLGAIPILARLYGIEAFGVFGIFSTASASLAVAAAGRFEQGIVPAANDRTALGLIYVSLGIVVLATLSLGGGLLAAMPALAAVVPSSAMRAALHWLPLGIGPQAIGQILLQWATRRHHDGAIARFYAERAVIMSGTQIAFGAVGTVQNGLILGQIAGFSVAALLLWRRLPGLSVAGGFAAMLKNAAQAARSHLDFPRYGLPRTLLEATATIAQPMMVAALYGAAAMGGYWMALRVLGLPGSMLGDPIRQVFFRRASERRRSGAPLVPLVLRAFLALSVITIPFAGILLAASKVLFLVFLGPAWNMAAIFIKIMVFAWLATFACGLLPSVVILLGLQRPYFAFEIILRVFEIAAILVGYVTGGVLVSLALWAAVDVAYVGALLWFLQVSEAHSTACAGPGGGESRRT